ncbi:glycosyltransferase family 4 protein [Leptospira kirschneri]|uniref:Glycosyltransferase, group 1 family protein n=1 Tax=Leptospira kirschneri serovar Bulgarica str. Nikolaevo TaxID=1240687 RepID=M6FDJ2_9LEPT|nr:glycosyltransferase family 1 protein [Leptospira kirschneri]EMK25157.1 glycosyltransferase, group 1 family protein [Leptospira kirschneri serovar Bulgarica str. Nikolaevo]
MILGIDASNIYSGGGVAHLVEVLRAADPTYYGFEKVIVWGGEKILNKLENRNWLEKSHEPFLDKSLLWRIYWQKFILRKKAKDCDLLFIPGGYYLGNFRPFVTINQNLLPFEWKEMKRYGLSWQFIRNVILYFLQSATFRKANGIIFLTRYAKDLVQKIIKKSLHRTAIIPHGIHSRFSKETKKQKKVNEYTFSKPLKILYVSTVDMYKHQWNVAEAVSILHDLKLPVSIEFIGSAYGPSLKLLINKMNQYDPLGKYIYYTGQIAHEKLQKKYHSADIFVFASSCETFGQIVTEAMAAGLPIACSNMSSMKEILLDNALYFNPEDPISIADSLGKLIESPNLRTKLARNAYKRSKIYNWKKTADSTFEFFYDVLNR